MFTEEIENMPTGQDVSGALVPLAQQLLRYANYRLESLASEGYRVTTSGGESLNVGIRVLLEYYAHGEGFQVPLTPLQVAPLQKV